MTKHAAARYVIAAVCAALMVFWSALTLSTAVFALLPSTGRWCADRR